MRDQTKRNQECRFQSYLRDEKRIDALGSRIITQLPYENEAGEKQQIDYVLLPSPFTGNKPHISGVLATCEFKGPARKTLWEFKRNWYNRDGKYGLVVDVQKQYRRARQCPDIERYCAWVVTLNERSARKKRDFPSSLENLSSRVRRDLDLPEEAIASHDTCLFDKITSHEMVMFVWRVKSA